MCPWCAIGLTQFLQARAMLEGEIALDIRVMPFELNPDMPVEGKEQDRHLAEVYGRSQDEVAAMRASLVQAAEEAGFPMHFPDRAMMWNTFEAHCLLRWALASAGADAQMRLKMALLAAHFQQQRNVGERATLLAIVAEQGLDPDAAAEALGDEALAIATRMEEDRGRQLGITAVPSFVVAGKYVLQGSRPPQDYAAMLRQIAALMPG
jgi:predicted DsbA family dithiol-disulfide isomerase